MPQNMKYDQQQQAEALFFKTDLSKAEIAEIVGVSRRAIHYWATNNYWDTLKKSAACLPTQNLEYLNQIMTKLATSILSTDRAFNPPTEKEILMVSQLGNTIKKLRTDRTTLSETIELRNHLMDFVHTTEPDIALEFQRIIDSYIKSRARVTPNAILTGKFDEYGCIPTKQENIKEAQLDIDDNMEWNENPPKPEDFIPHEIEITEEPETKKEQTHETPKLSERERYEAFMADFNAK